MSGTDAHPLGYRDPDAGTAEAFYEGFVWALPNRYDIAATVLDEHPRPDDRALDHRSLDGTRHVFTYGELDAAAAAIAAGLMERGIGRGDRVAVALPTCPEQVVIHLACYRIGAVVVPLSVLLGEDTVRNAVERTDPGLMVIHEAVAARWPDLPTGDTRLVHGLSSGPYSAPLPAVGGLAGLASPGVAVESPPLGPDDPALVLLTSGTTGAPKAVELPQSYLAGSLPGYQCWFELFERSVARRARVWTPSEWAWAGALFDVVFPTLALGGTVVSRERQSGFDPPKASDLLATAAISHAFLPPTALAKLQAADEPATPPSDLVVVMSGGESLSPALRAWAEKTLDATVNHAYGQTEANAVVGECTAAFEHEPEGMGQPYPGHDLAVVDDVGDPCPVGNRGELVLELPDPVAFRRYLGDAGATAEVKRQGRLHTGDLARWTEDGTLVHAGRVDDLIVTSGYRVDPLEVERALADHADVLAAVVGGVPDDVRGERVKAVVVPTTTPDEALRERLTQHVRDRLGAYKVPREIEFVEDLPETRTGKTDRDAVL